MCYWPALWPMFLWAFQTRLAGLISPSLHLVSEQTCGRPSAAPPSCGPHERTSPHHHHLTHQHQPAPDPPLSSAQLRRSQVTNCSHHTTPSSAPLCSTSSLEERIQRLAHQSRHLPHVDFNLWPPSPSPLYLEFINTLVFLYLHVFSVYLGEDFESGISRTIVWAEKCWI